MSSSVAAWDIHAHGLPQSVLDSLEASGEEWGATLKAVGSNRVIEFASGERTAPIREDMVDLDARLRRMDAAHVTGQVVAPWIDLTAYHLDARRGAGFSRLVNEKLAGMVSSVPDRLLGLATVPLQDPELAAVELHHAVVELGMVGVQIGTTVAGRDLHDPGLDVFWKTAEQLRCIVLVHPHQFGLAGRSESPYFMGNLIGNPSESTVAIGSLLFGGVLERFSELTIVSVHGGGFVPWQAGRWEHAYDVMPELVGGRLAKPPSEYLSRIYFDTVLHDPRSIEHLISWAGADRVVLGSDYPFPMGDSDPVATVESVSGLDAPTREAIVRGNLDSLIARVRRAPPPAEPRVS